MPNNFQNTDFKNRLVPSLETNTDTAVTPIAYAPVKRCLDLLGALIGIILFSPIFFVAAVAIKITSPGPLFAEMPPRVGKDGKLFHMYKFRSMVKGAYYMLQTDPKMKELYEEFKRNSYKLSDDPRVTPIGKFLRKTSIDEIPQFFNVLRGDMSLVGPRAYFPDELEHQQQIYPHTREFVSMLTRVKPGITGYWQVSGRSEINFDKRIEMDAEYVKRCSLPFDIEIMVKTLPVMLSGKGAS